MLTASSQTHSNYNTILSLGCFSYSILQQNNINIWRETNDISPYAVHWIHLDEASIKSVYMFRKNKYMDMLLNETEAKL